MAIDLLVAHILTYIPSEVANVMMIGTADSIDNSAHTCTVSSPSVTLSVAGTDTNTSV